MNVLLAARAVHFASSMLLFGELVFALAVTHPLWRSVDRQAFAQDERTSQRLLSIGGWSLLLSLASAAMWLAVEASNMRGVPLGQIDSKTLGLVLTKTVFGRLWILRFVVAVTLGAMLAVLARAARPKQKTSLALACVVLAGAYLGSLAWAGHAADGKGVEGAVQLSLDIVHLLAGGGWLGALPALIAFVGPSRPLEAAARIVHRFSSLGLLCVAALVCSGIANACYLVGSVPALVGTDYGRLLLLKLATFAAMVGLAAVNRLFLTPKLERHDSTALLLLRRNAAGEICAGIIVVAIVGALGTTVPGAHQPPVWPFEHTLSWDPAQSSPGIRWALAVAGAVACSGMGLVLAGMHRRKWRTWITGSAIVVLTAMVWVRLLAVPAYPTTYAMSPVGYTTASIAHGAVVYAQHCVACHGNGGRGDGPAAASLTTKPVDLVDHVPHHRVGEIYWWIAHGIPATPMPAFASQISTGDTWDVIQFLLAQSAVEGASGLSDRVGPWRPIVAPDFIFQIGTGAQESLQKQSGRYVLIVLYTLPQSLPRLLALSAESNVLARAGARVIAVPTDALAGSAVRDIPGLDRSMLATTGSDVATVYRRFAGLKNPPDAAVAPHAEFLIDRQGYLRARLDDVSDVEAVRQSWPLAEIEAINHEPMHEAPSEGQMHMHMH